MAELSWFKRLWDTFTDPISALLRDAADGPSTVLKPIPPPAGLALQYTLKSRWVSSLAWSPDGKLLAFSSDRGVQLWDPHTGRQLCILKGRSYSLAWSPDGKLLASAFDDRTVQLWDPRTSQLLRTLEDQSFSLAWSPDGKLLASGNGVWDPSTGQLLYPLNGLTNDVSHTNEINSVAWSPDGRLLASGSSGGAVQLWDPRTGQMLCILEGRGFGLYSVAWSSDGRLLAAGSSPGYGRTDSIRIWYADTWELLAELTGRNFNLHAAWNPRFSFLVMTGDLHSIFVWHLDLVRLFQVAPSSKVIHGTNANVMLMGDRVGSTIETEVSLSNGATISLHNLPLRSR